MTLRRTNSNDSSHQLAGISDPGYSEEEIASSQKPLLAMTAKAGSAIPATARRRLLHAREITEFSQ